MGCYTGEVSLHILRRDPVLGVGLLCNLIIRIGGQPMLLNSTQGISRSQHEAESSLMQRKIEEETSLLRRKIEELNRNTVLLIAEAGKLIQASEQLSIRLQSFEDLATKRRVAPNC
jgi:hypothetical protein